MTFVLLYTRPLMPSTIEKSELMDLPKMIFDTL